MSSGRVDELLLAAGEARMRWVLLVHQEEPVDRILTAMSDAARVERRLLVELGAQEERRLMHEIRGGYVGGALS